MKRLLIPLCWLNFACAMIILAFMLSWSFPMITHAAGGLTPFDLRPSGYSFEEARAFLAALPSKESEFYKEVQLGFLDKVYPALIGLTLFLGIGILASKRIGLWGWALALIAIPGTVFDYLENIHIHSMLSLGADNISAESVEQASAHTELKAMFSIMSISVLLILIALWGWDKFKSMRKAKDENA